MKTWAMLVATLVSSGLLAQASAKVTSIFKDPVDGEITGVDLQKRLQVKVKGSDVSEKIPLDEIEEISWGRKGDERRPDDAPLRVYLTNGDVLYGKAGNPDEEGDTQFKLTGRRFGTLTLDTEMLSRIEVVTNVQPNVLPALPEDAETDTTWFAADDKRPAQKDPQSELVRIVEDGVYLYNELLDDDNYEGTKYQWARVQGIICLRDPYDAPSDLTAIVTLRDGSVLRGEIASWAGGKLTLEHDVIGSKIVLEENNLLHVSMKNGRYLYLSDMEYASTPEERPYYLPDDFKYDDYLFKARKDQAQGGGPISIRGKVYPKGLGVHAISKIKYRLNKRFTRFVCDVGVDDSAGNLASVEFKIYADGKLVWESGVLRRSTKAKKVDLEMLDVEELTLEVTAADNADIQDRANWANAKVVR